MENNMKHRPLLVAVEKDDVSHVWRTAIKEGESRAQVSLSPLLEEHLAMTLSSNIKNSQMWRPVALDMLEGVAANDSLALVTLGGKCLIIAGFFPKLAARRNVRIGYYVAMGQRAYETHANYWEGRGARAHAHVSSEVAHNFSALIATLRGIRDDNPLVADLEAVHLPESAWN